MRSKLRLFPLAVFAAASVCAAQSQEPSAPPKGQVIVQSHGQSPEPDSDRAALAVEATAPEVTDAQRAAVRVTSYDLDAHISEATQLLSVHARLKVKNHSGTPLSLLPLQVSSQLKWEAASLVDAHGKRTTLQIAQHRVDTDTDHTGAASELVLTLPQALQPEAELELDVLYSGTVELDAHRLERIGASHLQAVGTDWDHIDASSVALRGFGNVLWYPVAAPAMFLGEGNRLFAAVGQAKLEGTTLPVRLRVALEYASVAPTAAYFRGARQDFRIASNDAADHDAAAGGVAVAEWPSAPAGFRTLNLFVTALPQDLLLSSVAKVNSAPTGNYSSSSSESPDGPPIFTARGVDAKVLPRLQTEAKSVVPMLENWFAYTPKQPLVLMEQHAQPFEDGPLLLAPADSFATSGSEPMLAYSLTRAWVNTGDAWIDEGLPQFFALLETERDHGRDTALNELNNLLKPLPLGEPSFASAEEMQKGAPGQPLVAATEEVFYRRKAAAVWWMLRDLAGEDALRKALAALPTLHGADTNARAVAFQKALEAASHKDLAWFFNDWVLRDAGLPDLSLVDVTPRPLPAGKGHDTGWLVAVTVHNDGGATAEVPLTVRSGALAITRPMRVPAFSSATDRVFIQTAPTEVTLNDGSVPEARTSLHQRTLNVRTTDK
ncbi:hypothetical protein ACFQBQ_07310 [Granulicella cerasi]|uniref:Peptidase M1 membrane alanine aminopeptidase domain-containing protein n=1 Tax=Granulicella cerasi TaxID=741063 RepID=A0ABW1ZAE4_9BACT|nr:hypothetical protein [Granulicella cerasi]